MASVLITLRLQTDLVDKIDQIAARQDMIRERLAPGSLLCETPGTERAE